jgi:hypothetical protein
MNTEAKEIEKQINHEYYELTKKALFEKVKQQTMFCNSCNKMLHGWSCSKHFSSVEHKLNLMSEDERQQYKLDRNNSRKIKIAEKRKLNKLQTINEVDDNIVINV